MDSEIKDSISHMLQGIAHWMAYMGELSYVNVIESDVVFVAANMLQTLLPQDYSVDREVTKKTLSLIEGKKRIDLGIRNGNKYKCLIEFKLADATNEGYVRDITKLQSIKAIDPSINCLVVIVYRKSCDTRKVSDFIGNNGYATRKTIVYNGSRVKVRRVCNSFTSKSNDKSKKTICLELL